MACGAVVATAIVRALQLLDVLVRAHVAVRLAIADARQIEELQVVCRFVYLTAEVAVLQIEKEHLIVGADLLAGASAHASGVALRLRLRLLGMCLCLCVCGTKLSTQTNGLIICIILY